MRDGAVLVDVREADEHARERIPGARHHALTPHRSNAPIAQRRRRADLPLPLRRAHQGQRRAARRRRAECETYILDGGLDAWKKAGLPVALDRSQPIDIMRQVQIAAGSLVLLGVVLGVFVAPAFYALSGFVGAGLLFAGVSGFCGMARLLAVMPWNRRAAAAT